MANVNDYSSGRILIDAKRAIYALKFVKIPLIGPLIGKKLLNSIKSFEPQLKDIKTVSTLIQGSKKCAVGERVCRAIYKNSEPTESIFLNELAEEMVRVGKAQYVTKEEAINTLKKYPGKPLILSKVSNKYMEICPSVSSKCVYWEMEKQGLKCLHR